MAVHVLTSEDLQPYLNEIADLKALVKELLGKHSLGAYRKVTVAEMFDGASQSVMNKLVEKRVITPFKLYDDGYDYFEKVEVLKLLPSIKEIIKKL